MQQFRRDLIESVRHITEELTEIMNSTSKRVVRRPTHINTRNTGLATGAVLTPFLCALPQAQHAPASRGRMQWLRDTRHRLMGGRDKGKGDGKRGESKRTALEALFDSPIPEGTAAEEAGAPAPADDGVDNAADKVASGTVGGDSSADGGSTAAGSSVAASADLAEAASQMLVDTGAVGEEPGSDEELGAADADSGSAARVPSIQSGDDAGGHSGASEPGDASSISRSDATGASDNEAGSVQDTEPDAASSGTPGAGSGAEEDEAATNAAAPSADEVMARNRARSSSEDPTPAASAGPPYVVGTSAPWPCRA